MKQALMKGQKQSGWFRGLLVIFFTWVLCMGCMSMSCAAVQPTETEAQTETEAEPVTVKATMNVSAKTKQKTAVYQQASTTTKKVTTLSKGKELMIKGELSVQGVSWCRISATVNGKTVNGYLKKSSVKQYDMFAQNTGKTNTKVILRKTMSTTAKKVATLNKNTKVTVYSKQKKGKYTWYYVSAKLNGKTKKGYIVTKYVNLTKTTVKSTIKKAARVKESTGLYKTANTKDQKYATLDKETEILVLGTLTVGTVKWSKVKADVAGKMVTGYIKSSKVGSWKITNYVKYGVGKLNEAYDLKAEPNVNATKIKHLKKGIEVSIDGYVKMGDVIWYHCMFLSDIGFLPETVLTITDEPSKDMFYSQIENFPASYQESLTALHAAHPNWQFVAVDTALSWDYVVANENIVGRNTIQSNYPKGGSSLAPFSYLSTDEGAYDWSTDTYKVKDGTNWYAASEDVIKYYLDPRNFLTESGIYQFEALSYDSGQKINVVDAILKNTFMSGNYSVVDKLTNQTVSGPYNKLFMKAGKKAGASPYFLARTARLELGTSGSGSVSGTYAGYEGIYNYFNIGANDSAGGGAIANGLKWASGGSTGETSYQRPWTNPEKSIIGGAEYISATYISKGQNTSYYKKFNVVNYASGLFLHQYCTNVQGAASEANLAKSAYAACDMTNSEMVFYIPFYDKMPSKPCKLPETKGNPNYYLSALTVMNAESGESLSLNQTFQYKTLDYKLAAPKGTSSVKISAKAVSKYASVKINGTAVSGSETKTISVKAGKTTTVEIVCTAGNGKKKTYTLKIAVAG
ncbi:MAG: cadherin-like beta sandwich domain-containing protein [Lachnospiraceae bacterium]|nr:cadherin-like beta sandwich domain-containing protein [Lachnospiraceae bacterium]